MAKIAKSLNEAIKDKSYFKEGLDWYLAKFCFPISGKFLWAIIVILLIFINIKLYKQIEEWFPIITKKPIVLINTDSEYKQVVKKMDNPHRDTNLAILEYLIINYIRTREEFNKGSLDLLKIDTRLRNIANISSRNIYRSYKKIFYAKTKENPIKRLGNSGIRKVNIISVNIDLGKQNLLQKLTLKRKTTAPTKAIIIFQTIEKKQNKNTVQKWQLNLTYRYSKTQIKTQDKEKIFTPPEFIVNEYILQELKI